jgi:Uncharacterised protein family UPF0547
MIFGGYGKKSKQRGEVFYPCVECGDALSVHGLIESYGYGQLYGVRIAKVGTHRFMVCSKCQRGWELTKPQWDAAKQISNGLRSVQITGEVMVRSAIRLAERVFPDMAPAVRELFTETPQEVGDSRVLALAAPSNGESAQDSSDPESSSDGDTKTCPDCAEAVRLAARKCRFCGWQFDAGRLSA